MKSASLLIVLLATACAGKADVAPEPKWMKEKGRVEVQIELAEALVEHQQSKQALPILAALRSNGWP